VPLSAMAPHTKLRLDTAYLIPSNNIYIYIYIVITKLCAAAMQPRYVPVLAGYVYKAVRFLKRTDPNRRDFSFFSWGPPARELYLLRVCQ